MQHRKVVKTRHTYDYYYLLAYFQPRQQLRQRKHTYKTLSKDPSDALLNHGGRHCPMAAMVTPSLHQGIQQSIKTIR
jgi:hypothetical protein